MPPSTNDGRSSRTDNPLKQITPRQWVLAALILVAVPIAGYFGTYYLYPYVQDRLEGETAMDAVLADYGVSEDAETQLLTIRRGDLVNSVAVNGTLAYARREQLSFGLGGTVDEINVDVGDRVSEGDVLMLLQNQAIVLAQEEFQDASLALQNAEQELADLINPEQRIIDEANLKVLQAGQKFSDAEAKFDDLLNPSELDIENAKLEISKSEKALHDAESKLNDLLNPADIDIQNASLAVEEARQAVADAANKIEDIEREEHSEIAAAQLALSEAEKEHRDAMQALDDLLVIDSTTINELELDVEKAQLDVIDAGSAVSDAEATLAETENMLEDTFEFDLEVAQANADLTAAKLAYEAAEDALSEATEPDNDEEAADLADKIAEAENDIVVAQDQLTQLEIETESQLATLETSLQEAQEAYQDVFWKWLGLDITSYEWQASPDEIFEYLGISLKEILAPDEDLLRISRHYEGSDDWLEDDPDTPWNETVTAGWSEFFVSNLRFDCTETGNGIGDECVNIEFEDAWEELDARSEAHRIFVLGNSQKLDNAEDAVRAAEKTLEDLTEQLEDLLEPIDEDVMSDLAANLEVAQLKLQDAQRNLDTLLGEADERRQNRETEHLRAVHALTVAVDEFAVAEDKLRDASEVLSEQMEGADEIDVALAQSRIDKAATDVDDADNALQDLLGSADEESEMAQHELAVATTDLAEKIAALEELASPDTIEIEVLSQEIEVARLSVADKTAAFNDLTDPDALEVELAQQEIEVARAEAQTASDELDEIVNPDPVTVAVRRAEVATAREDLESAQIAIERTSIIAPFDGVISTVSVEVGANVAKDAAMIELVDPSIVEISGTVDEVDVLFLQVGDPASIELEAFDAEPLVGQISDIAAFGESNQGVVTYPVTIQTEQPSDTQLPEGLSAVAEVIIREQNDRLLVPIQAIFGSINAPVLLISNPDGTLQPRNVTLGISDDFWTVVEDGVVEGETLLMSVVGADTSLFGGFGGIRTFAGGGGPPRGR